MKRSPSFAFPIMQQSSFPMNPFQAVQVQRIRNILFVASQYDSFCIEEDGVLSEQITSMYLDFNLAVSPHLHRASNLADAKRALQRRTFELVIVVAQFNDADLWSTLHTLKTIENPKGGVVPPVIPLCFSTVQMNTPSGASGFCNSRIPSPKRVFYYKGDTSIVFAVIKMIEDRLNVSDDAQAGVRVVILVCPDDLSASTKLVDVYLQLLQSMSESLPKKMPTFTKLRRMQARPKILLANSYEEASSLIEQFSVSLLGVITSLDIEKPGDHLGLSLANEYKKLGSFLFISDNICDVGSASEEISEGVTRFLYSGDPEYKSQLKSYFSDYLGFGDFVFRTPDGKEVGRARNPKALAQMLSLVPESSVLYHAGAMDFSHWFFARGEFSLAYQTSVLSTDFGTARDIIVFLRRCIASQQRFHGRGAIVDFAEHSLETIQETPYFMKLGAGSIGGKARGTLFMDRLISNSRNIVYGEHGLSTDGQWPNVNFATPRSFVLTTEIFDTFMDTTGLRKIVSTPEFLKTNDEEVTQIFLKAELQPEVVTALTQVLQTMRSPIACRSSSLLEDSMRVAAAGIYETFFVTNSSPDPHTRLHQLCASVKLVYASCFFEKARKYLSSCNVDMNQEKMAVLIQEVVGCLHQGGNSDTSKGRWYPDISGVAQSYNFYALDGMKPESGIGYIALGLGKAVVDKGYGYKFGLDNPRVSYLFNTTDYVRKTQREFFAIDMDREDVEPTMSDMFSIGGYSLATAEADKSLKFVGSIYSSESGGLTDSIYGDPRKNIRLVTFRPILVHNLYIELAEILKFLVGLAEEGVGGAAELEFAINLQKSPLEFVILQMRPMTGAPPMDGSDEIYEQMISEDPAVMKPLVTCSLALGHGLVEGVRDIVFCRPSTFDRNRTQEIANEFTELNIKLKREGIPFMAVCLGRWGTSEPSLGVPIDWGDISGARVLIETGLDDYIIEPSFATHWIHNVMTLNIPFMYVHPKTDFFDFEYLNSLPAVEERVFLRHVRLPGEIGSRVCVSGQKRAGVVLRPVM